MSVVGLRPAGAATCPACPVGGSVALCFAGALLTGAAAFFEIAPFADRGMPAPVTPSGIGWPVDVVDADGTGAAFPWGRAACVFATVFATPGTPSVVWAGFAGPPPAVFPAAGASLFPVPLAVVTGSPFPAALLGPAPALRGWDVVTLGEPVGGFAPPPGCPPAGLAIVRDAAAADTGALPLLTAAPVVCFVTGLGLAAGGLAATADPLAVGAPPRPVGGLAAPTWSENTNAMMTALSAVIPPTI